MKLFFCNNCNTAFSPTVEIKSCECGASSARLTAGIVYFSGLSGSVIDVNKTDIELLVTNYMDRTAVIESADDIKNREKGKEKDRNFCTKIIEYLNEKAGTTFSTNYPSSNSKLIISRRDEQNCSLEDFYRVINNKVLKWKDTDFEIYLRPKTLFNKTNFSNYLGEKNATQQPSGKSFDKLASTANEAKRNIINRGQQSS